MQLRGKGALITGGGSGIGQAVALTLANDGCKVAIAGRSSERLRNTAALWKGEPPIVHHHTDVADRDSVERLFTRLSNDFGPIDILVNNAGINIKNRSIAEMNPTDWDRVLQINATGCFNCTWVVLPQMRQRKDGLIINISSIAGKRASLLGGVAYCASKFAMTALGKSVSLEDGKNGVRVTNIYPGEVDTPILNERPEPVGERHRSSILQPEDVAASVLMVACLPARAHVAELVIKPTLQDYS